MMTKNVQISLSKISPQAFLNFGIEDMAYVKQITVDGKKGYAIHAADGTEISILEKESVAMATLVQNDLDALKVH